MKRFLTALLVLTMVFALAACGGGDAPAAEAETEPQGTEAPATETPATEAPDADDNLIGFGNYSAVYKGGELTKDSDGADAIVLTFDYTNNSSELESFGWSFYYDAKQGTEELSTAIIYVNEEQTKSISDSEYIQAEPGTTMEIKLAYDLVNLTDDVIIHFTNLSGDYEDTLTISLADCTQA